MIEQPETLKGSYRLYTAPIAVNITSQMMTIALKKAYTLSCHRQAQGNSLTIKRLPSEQGDILEEDREVVELFEAVEQCEAGGNLIRFYGKDQSFFMRGRREEKGEEHGEDSVLGHWQVELVNLPLEVSQKRFSFKGINHIRYLLAYTATKSGNISFELQSQSQQKQGQKKEKKNEAKIDFDVIFINALLRSTKFKRSEVSFQLFGADGRLTARGTPYMY